MILVFLHCRDNLANHFALLLHRCNKSSEPIYHCMTKKWSHGRLVVFKKEQLEECGHKELQWKKIRILMYPHV